MCTLRSIILEELLWHFQLKYIHASSTSYCSRNIYYNYTVLNTISAPFLLMIGILLKWNVNRTNPEQTTVVVFRVFDLYGKVKNATNILMQNF